MRSPKSAAVMLVVSLCALALTGCIDAVKDGVTGGITEGIEDVISEVFGLAFEGVIDSE